MILNKQHIYEIFYILHYVSVKHLLSRVHTVSHPTPGPLAGNQFIPEIFRTRSCSFIRELDPVPQTVDGAARCPSSFILCHNCKDISELWFEQMNRIMCLYITIHDEIIMNLKKVSLIWKFCILAKFQWSILHFVIMKSMP